MIRKMSTRARSVPTTLRVAALVACALCTGSAACAQQSTAAPGSEQQQIDALTQQLKAVQEQMKELAQQNQALLRKQQEIQQQMSKNAPAGAAVAAAPAQNPVPPASNPTPPAPPGPALSASNSSPFGDLKLWGYGEIYYTRPTHDVTQTQADLARAVFGIGYVFDSRTEFNSEFEVEHAVSSASDPGEFEVEQFYIDRKL
ncbi:MAG TPA: hypothetical protein VGI65_05110, partial [Steroidobacteraceae bacterium]